MLQNRENVALLPLPLVFYDFHAWVSGFLSGVRRACLRAEVKRHDFSSAVAAFLSRVSFLGDDRIGPAPTEAVVLVHFRSRAVLYYLFERTELTEL